MILETKEEIHQWLKEQCPAFVRYVGDNLSSLCDHFLQRINEGTGGLAELSCFKRPIEFTKKAIKALLDAGADPLKENKKGKSALSLAEKAGNADIIKMLSK